MKSALFPVIQFGFDHNRTQSGRREGGKIPRLRAAVSVLPKPFIPSAGDAAGGTPVLHHAFHKGLHFLL